MSLDNETFVLITIMPVPPAHIRTIMPSNNTGNAQLAQLAHVLNTLLVYAPVDPIPTALADGGYLSLLDVTTKHSDDIDALIYTHQGPPIDPNRAVPLAHKQKLRIFISLFHHWGASFITY
jgi:hypothetical protein